MLSHHILYPILGALSSLATAAPAQDQTTPVNPLSRRAASSTDWCFKWAQQAAVVNGTVYLQGGHITTESTQDSNTWTSDFVALDLTTTWPFSAPPFKPLPKDAELPAVANAYLWASYDSLFLYGGLYSDDPVVLPTEEYSLWEYDISDASWVEHSNPVTSEGVNAPDNNVPVLRAAEGSGFSVAALGKGWYFGGHQDRYTTPGWDNSIYRLYLKSMLEFTFPGYSNSGVTSLQDGQVAGDDGVWRNITLGGIQDSAGFPERADGVLLYVPGYGDEGILIGLAGGTNTTFTELNVIDVYDIANSVWYKQATTGPTPSVRVNPCSVVAAAEDGSSFNIYMFGGQNLRPYESQVQLSDTWILSIPSFSWINAKPGGQTPPPRAGHTCNVWDGQMVSVGGYQTGILSDEQLTCDYPGVYVLDLSTLQWVPQFTATSDAKKNPQSKQIAQMEDPRALSGSYGYAVPNEVVNVIGGDSRGGATLTAPVVIATSGPLATGSVPTYTIIAGQPVATNGAAGVDASSSSSDNGGLDGGVLAGIIVASVLAFLLLLTALYLGFCAYLYRRQLQHYKNSWEPGAKPDGALGPGNGDGSAYGAAAIADKRRQGRPRPTGRGKYAQESSENSSSPSMRASNKEGSAAERRDSTEDLLGGQEPSFVGIMLHPRRSLRITNPD